jgi:hypothetical protein
MREEPGLVDRYRVDFGRMISKFGTLRQMSLNVAALIDLGQAPALQAALVKDLGTSFEQEVVTLLRRLVEEPLHMDFNRNLFLGLLARSTLVAPSYTLRGGTNEVLRSVVAKGLR